ncbi:nitroreductase/quinone reductase family protein [Gordonia sp. (in: high G+C Gram-positive bacteria)]|uniref:nitroreductase/quinone reductase family protein n=1 Tax=Gordonia sp. (in: high G+C Gram-positive bacteria) TaxID=84139 RepID=UPI0039E21B38
MNDFNAQVVDEFRANNGKVGGPFEGAPMVLLHHVGRKSGTPRVTPLMYMADDADPDVVYLFASMAGAPTNPAWYHNLLAAGTAEIERGDERYAVDVDEVTGADRDRIYAEQASRYPGFAEYEQKTRGVRTIPVLALRRSTGDGGRS